MEVWIWVVSDGGGKKRPDFTVNIGRQRTVRWWVVVMSTVSGER